MIIAIIVVLVLALGGAGAFFLLKGGGKGSDGKGSAAVSSYEDAKEAVVYIRAKGAIRDPEVGDTTVSGSGSGFVISPDGLVVTNNHVVTGAATLEIWVGGDYDKTWNATVLGVSECNDLAVLQLSGASNMAYLDFYKGEIKVGMDIWVAGFPLGDKEYSLTKGIVNKANADGDITGTSSIDHTIEHDATSQPGNSGGPLLNENGQVVGIHYAGWETSAGERLHYAIAADLAVPVVDTLKGGDFESIGVNGFAIDDDESGLVGIWVSGVAPGSPAAKVGILAGDIITTMNGLPVGQNRNFSGYCNVIRTAGQAPISVEVLRFDTSEMLRGEINGDKVLEQTVSFRQEIEDQTGGGGVGGGGADYTYEMVVDDTGVLQVEVPVQWSSRDTAPIQGDTPTPAITASPNINSYDTGWNTPGVTILRIPEIPSSDDVLSAFGSTFASGCTVGEISDYADGMYTGRFQVYSDCGGTDTVGVVLVTSADAGGHGIVLVAQVLTEADVGALQHAFETFMAK
ncbi:MAG: S1C family serine protease [Micrococcales bacterium]|nr:S1C family serine protease [Micrococcales bacterium]